MVHLKGYMYKWVMEDLGKKIPLLFVSLQHIASYKITESTYPP